MSFLNSEYFWLLILLVPLFKYRDFKNFKINIYGYLLTYFFIVVAISRPVIESQPIQNDEILNDVIVAIDISYSMQAEDIKPNRLEYSKMKFNEIVEYNTKSRFGVLAFTTNAIVLSPLTQDSELIKHLLNALNQKLIVTKGSSIMPALKLARKMSSAPHPSVVIFTDGGDEENYEKEARYAKENSLKVNIFMVATKYGSTLKLANEKLLKDENNAIVVSRANEAISSIADATGGIYTSDFDNLLQALQTQRNRDYKSKTTTINNIELFYIFILLAIGVFLVSVTNLKNYVISFLLLYGVTVNACDRIAFDEANSFYREGEYEKALLKYETLTSNNIESKSIIFYNMANTFVRLKEFKKARENYLKSLTLLYSKEADENMYYIKDVKEQKQMSSGQQKSDKKSTYAKQTKSSKKKEGGSSNMKVSANAGSGASKNSKKSLSESILNLSQGRAKLSSKQYELINKRSINEKRPY